MRQQKYRVFAGELLPSAQSSVASGRGLLVTRSLLSVVAVVAACAVWASTASASTRQVSLVVDNPALDSNPAGTLQKLHEMGVTMVKYSVAWASVAPDPNSTKVPAAATDPASYQSRLGQVDVIDENAAKYGIKVGLSLTGPAPRWAEAAGGTTAQEVNGTHRPNAAYFKTFVKALGARYNGSTVSDGVTLPAITWWSVWNEPNYVVNISPQLVGTSTYESADLYRALVDSAWAGLKASGHSGNTFLFGELAPRAISSTKAANAVGVKPVQFLASLYCVTTAGKRLTGRIAAANGCPANASTFKSENPALFDASGVADHPTVEGVAPDLPTYDCASSACASARTKKSDSLWTDLGAISHLENALAVDLKAYGSDKKYPIWNTEFGYWATPSRFACRRATQADCALLPATAAYYDNWAEYISYKNPRIASFAQYQLYEPTSGAWTDGLLTQSGAPRTAYDAFELPLFLPATKSTVGKFTVWGGVRPAEVNQLTYNIAPEVEIQFKPKSGNWKTIKTMTVSGPDGYFDTTVSIASSGSVRLLYPDGITGSLTSRTQTITIT